MDTHSMHVNRYEPGKAEIIFEHQNHKEGRISWILYGIMICCMACGAASLKSWQIATIMIGFLIFLAIVRSEYERAIINKDIAIETCITEINALANDRNESLNTSAFDAFSFGLARETKYIMHVMRLDPGFAPHSVLGTNNYDDARKMAIDMRKHGFNVEIRHYKHTVSSDECNSVEFSVDSF